MAARLWSWLARPSLLRTLVQQARLAVRLVREPAVRWAVRAIPVLAGLYVVSPIDIVPDVLPLVGELDDLGILLVAVQAFIHLCPAPLVEYHRAAIANRRPYAPMPSPGPSTPTASTGPIIDAEFRHKD
jgi:uncharacterized membrane protein YkvA (DUF1232 family)